MTFLFHTNDDESVVKLSQKLSDLNDRNKEKRVGYLVTIKKNKPVRGHDANAYYWVCLQQIAVLSGHTTEELHELYKLKFNNKYVIDEYVPQTTTDLDTREFSIYVNKVKEHARSFYAVDFREPQDEKYLEWMSQTKEQYDAMFAAI